MIIPAFGGRDGTWVGGGTVAGTTPASCLSFSNQSSKSWLYPFDRQSLLSRSHRTAIESPRYRYIQSIDESLKLSVDKTPLSISCSTAAAWRLSLQPYSGRSHQHHHRGIRRRYR